ncbi:MAG: hypothetical protein CUN56_05970 [Phototrophicales bacterium]|nr:MAG: hypothetical protein CUN56_05970 [Phototrophicales bacterium]RMG73418.1 MAG: DUF87 domain-containing protein [Chloroflexota bacterium]
MTDEKNQQVTEETPSQKPKFRTVEPEFWDDILDALPPWFDEISGIVLFVFGVISIMSLMGIAGDAVLAKSWSDALTYVFGKGSWLVAAGIALSGVLIFLPKMGIPLPISGRRVLAIQVMFLAILGVLHLLPGDAELRAIVRSGEGGGLIGWGISMPLNLIFGRAVALIILSIMILGSIAVLAGVRQAQIISLLEHTSTILNQAGEKLANTPIPQREKKPKLPPQPGLADIHDLNKPRRTNIIRIRPDPDNLPPSMRLRESSTQPIEPTKPEIPAILAMDTRPQEEISQDIQRLDAVLKTSEESPSQEGVIKVDATIIGKPLPKKKKTEPTMVTRPDGRIKHYFTAEEMREVKKLVKRDKDLPPLNLLQDVAITPPSEEEINLNVVLIENTLLEFDINVDVVAVKAGPTVTQYGVQPFREVKKAGGEIVKERTRLSKIAALASDLSLALAVKRLRLEMPVPGHSYMGIEVPNRNPSTVALRSVYESKAFFDASQKQHSPLLVPLGRDVAGEPVIVDLATMPHLLIAGTTGSGKSVAMAAIATALLINNMPDKIKLVMLDPKMVELSRFNGVPHLIGPVETDLDRIIGVLRWCTREMERRYKLLEEASARNIEIYNAQLKNKENYLPYIVIMVDEIGDLMMTKPEETEHTVTRLAQMARAVGMHMIIATQRPSVDVITGLIKANFPTRISFAVASGVDSRVILDTGGAENLLGKGDMLYLAQDAAGPRRLQGCFVTDGEVRAIVNYWREWYAKQIEKGKLTANPRVGPWERGLTRREFLAETDPMLEEAIELVVEEQEASASQIQRKLNLGYPRAARIIDLLEELGVIGEPIAGGRSRRVLIEKGKDPFKEIIDKRTQKKNGE